MKSTSYSNYRKLYIDIKVEIMWPRQWLYHQESDSPQPRQWLYQQESDSPQPQLSYYHSVLFIFTTDLLSEQHADWFLANLIKNTAFWKLIKLVTSTNFSIFSGVMANIGDGFRLPPKHTAVLFQPKNTLCIHYFTTLQIGQCAGIDQTLLKEFLVLNLTKFP